MVVRGEWGGDGMVIAVVDVADEPSERVEVADESEEEMAGVVMAGVVELAELAAAGLKVKAGRATAERRLAERALEARGGETGALPGSDALRCSSEPAHG